jgi:signal transduction histidine kinase
MTAEIERAEKLIAELNAQLERERADPIKDEFLNALSHELGTPLSAIASWAYLLRHGSDDPAIVRQGIEVIERNAKAQALLIEDLLDLSRIVSGKVGLDVQSVAPLGIIEAALESVLASAIAKDIRVHKTLDPLTGPLAADPGRLQQIVWHLLSNAIKFTPKGGTVSVVLQRVNSQIEISVADNGIGIAPDILPQLFEHPRQHDASIARAHGALGIGLAIVKRLVELHGGEVRAKSPGAAMGSTFVVSLPASAEVGATNP